MKCKNSRSEHLYERGIAFFPRLDAEYRKFSGPITPTLRNSTRILSAK